MIKVLRIGHATFETPDLAKAIEHYTQVIGFSLAGREEQARVSRDRDGELAIELHQARETGCSKLSFKVAPDADFARPPSRLQKHGVAAEDRTISRARPAQGAVVPGSEGHLDRTVPRVELLGATPQVVGAGVLKLGHVAFVTPRPQRPADFYEQVLGFRKSDSIGDFFVFLRCNADHHAVNFIARQRT